MPAPPAKRSAASIAVIAAAVAVIISALLLVGESRYRTCIARAEAEYPAVPVSAFNSNQTGPLKVSFIAERSKALDDCSRF